MSNLIDLGMMSIECNLYVIQLPVLSTVEGGGGINEQER
jgi:hypothetical protein